MEVELRGTSPPKTECSSQPIDDGNDSDRLQEVINCHLLSFDDWTSLISDIEEMSHDDIERLSLVYDSFLSKFPLCHVYWRKYADHIKRLCGTEKAIEVFEQAVLAVTYCVALWVDYCQFALSIFEDPEDVRRLFKRALSFVGKDYSCYSLWDKYIEFEFSQQCWSTMAHIFIQTLRFPTKKLHHYYKSLEKLVAIWEEELKSQCCDVEPKPDVNLDNELQVSNNYEETCEVIRKLLDSLDGHTRSRELQKYKAIGERLYKSSCLLDDKIHCFESKIHRSYFHVKPLDTAQLENWHEYLDFVEKQNDFDWAVKLYERCLIPAANYSEFWIRYVVYADGRGGREIASFALDRATKTFLKDVPSIHLCSARFKEASRDMLGARAALLQLKTELDDNFIDNIIIKASMERRLGNLLAASKIYRDAIDMAILKKELGLLPTLHVHYSQHLYVTTKCAVTARDILIEGIKHMPGCKLLYEELIKFATTHGGREHIDVVGSVVADALSTVSGEVHLLDTTDQKYISNLYLKFVDLCGTIDDVRIAWNQHVNIFRHFLRTECISPPTGTKTWKSLLKGKHKTSSSSPQEIGRLSKGQSPTESPTFSPKLPSVSNDSSEIGHPSLNRSVRQSLKNDVSVQDHETFSEDNSRSEQDHVVNQEHPSNALETLSPDPARDGPSCSVLLGSHELEDRKELSVSNQVVWQGDIAVIRHSPLSQASDRAESQYHTQDNSPFESQSRGHQVNHKDQVQQDSRFGLSGHVQRRTHHQKQLNPPRPQHPLTTRETLFSPLNQQTRPVSDAGNQFQPSYEPNCNFTPMNPGQVPAGYGIQPHVQFPDYSSLQGSEQSGGKLYSNQAYYNQMWQYYYYYLQQQNFLQQQMHQLNLTQAQLQQHSPEYQTVSHQINQLQQQQQHLYQLQQLLYQQMQQHQSLQQQQQQQQHQSLQQQQQPLLPIQQQLPPLQQHQSIPQAQQLLPLQQQSNHALQTVQQDLPFYPQSQQILQLQQSFQQQQLDQSDDPQPQKDQRLKYQQKTIEEYLEEEHDAKKSYQHDCIP
ncbi:hypothetical protein SAY86_022166 [Trapa natans]|uniref:Pre-mRNA-processing factor 39 n=1 Tax=Trapa natans TaxID=22666 RepID=A0AAN7RDJ8_TRANT|nr:hypothetical protein SAY86_022166 [Trapa natans]